MEFPDPAITEYSEKFTSPESAVLHELNRETHAKILMPRMLSGHLQGRILSMISHMICPKNILEIGTYTGYRAVSLAKGLNPGGELHTIELREQEAVAALANFNKAGMHQQIILHTGNALEIIPTLDRQWDMVFIDADKANYLNYYHLVIDGVKPGGYILADNVLFHGQVLEDELKGKNAKAIDAFNKHVAADERTEQVMLTVRDGLMLIRKL